MPADIEGFMAQSPWYRAYRHSFLSQIQNAIFHKAKEIYLVQATASEAFPTVEEFDAAKADVRKAYAMRDCPFFSPGGMQKLPYEAISWLHVPLQELAQWVRQKVSPNRTIIICSCPEDQVSSVEKVVMNENCRPREGVAHNLMVLTAWATARLAYGERHTTLHFAATRGHARWVQLLLERFVDIEVQDDFGETPLYKSVLYNQLEVVKVLIYCNANVDAQTVLGWTPLIKAADLGLEEMVQLLLLNDAGVGIVTQEPSGQTALHRAAHQGHLAIASHLLEHGADLDVADSNVETPFDIALRLQTWPHKELVKLFRAAKRRVGFKSYTPPTTAGQSVLPSRAQSPLSPFPRENRCIQCGELIHIVDDEWNFAGLCDTCMDNV